MTASLVCAACISLHQLCAPISWNTTPPRVPRFEKTPEGGPLRRSHLVVARWHAKRLLQLLSAAQHSRILRQGWLGGSVPPLSVAAGSVPQAARQLHVCACTRWTARPGRHARYLGVARSLAAPSSSPCTRAFARRRALHAAPLSTTSPALHATGPLAWGPLTSLKGGRRSPFLREL